MKKIKSILILLMLGTVLMSACKRGPSSSHDNKNRQIKKGKPIPCPIKDC